MNGKGRMTSEEAGADVVTGLSPEITAARELADELRRSVEGALIARAEIIDLALLALFCRGHVLIEDVPGIGKTTLARALSSALGCTFRRIQSTPDLMPSDLLGVNVFNQKSGDFEFMPGPVFSHVLLCDEINRATPRTQSALLEAMQEGQTTIDGVTMSLPEPFLVLATQNPIEMEGTFPLPEAQLDRFFLLVKLGYPSNDDESEMLARFGTGVRSVEAEKVASPERLRAAQEAVATVRVDEAVRDYVVAVSAATREHGDLTLGASPRASLSLMRASQARAAMEGRDYVVPDDVKALATPVLAHRLVLTSTARLRSATAESVVANVLASVPVPIEK